MKITQKLLLTIAVLIVGFLVIGFVYRQVLQIEAEARELNAETREFARLAQELQADLQSAWDYYNDFLLNKDLIALESFESTMAATHESIAALRERTTSEDFGGALVGLAESTKTLHDQVYAVAEPLINLGLDENSGLHGEMRDAVHEVESKLAAEIGRGQAPTGGSGKEAVKRLRGDVVEQKLRASMLQMRRHEKDFLQRRDTKYVERMDEEQGTFALLLEDAPFSKETVQEIATLMSAYRDSFGQVAGAIRQIGERMIQTDTAGANIPPLIDEILTLTDSELQASNRLTEEKTAGATWLFVGVLIAVGLIVAASLLLLSAGMARTLGVLQNTVRKVSEGDSEARSELTGSDELHSLGRAFDNLLDERMAILAEAQRENEQLNDSIIELLQAVAQLSQRDLTVKVPVAENVTGPVADSLNLFANETAKVLSGVTRISDEVAAASNTVKGQSDTVMALAENERRQVVQTSAELAAAAEAMNEIAELAQASNRAADEAIAKTRAALETVTGTVSGINATRDTIRETEKRIKRLGERSQEITGAVNLINNIAERTHILALNASMHAASAGEAGRGFAVVADEVQRLAENARQATEQIANLVSNIQTETQDTVATMNAAISQVVDGSRLAEQAGERMRETQESTAALVGSVQRIAEGSQTQAKISNELQHRARQIEESTAKTSQQLQEQGVQTANLLKYAQDLVESVRVFTLPAVEEEPAAPPVRESKLKVVQG